MEEQEQAQYPPKPSLEIQSRKTNWPKAIFSLLLFFLIFWIIGLDPLIISFVIVVLLIHEGGHFLAMKLFGYKNVNLFFVPLMGALTIGQKENAPYKQEAIMIMAGPIPGLVIGMIIIPFSIRYSIPWLGQLGTVFLMLNLFNMIPILPLDGGRLFDKLFAAGKNWLKMILLGLSLLGIIGYVVFVEFSFIIILGLAIAGQMQQTYKIIRGQAELRKRGIDYRTSYAELSPKAYWEIARIVKEKQPESNDMMVALQVRELMSYTSSKRLTVFQTILFFVVWVIFVCLPAFEVLIFGDLIANLWNVGFGGA